jgi:hypothetical protein
MIEFVRHALGFCGEHWHPNIFHMLVGGSTISYVAFRVRNIFGTKKINKT